MKKIFYLHWNKKELEKRVAPLNEAGRLPSHARHFAGWFWEAKKRQHIPIVFAGRKPNKIAVAKEQYPNALFCTTENVLTILNKIFPT